MNIVQWIILNWIKWFLTLRTRKSLQSSANVEKGRTLEDLSVYLLSCVEPFDVEYDYKTPVNQLDAIVEVLSFKGNNNFLSEIGSIFCAECKMKVVM